MTTKELMVGDWVFAERHEGIYGGPVWKQPGIVRKLIEYDEINVLFPDECGDSEYDESLTFLPKEIEGIPLTPEILQKNGFKKQSPGEYSTAPRWFWGKEGKRDGALIVISFYDPPVNGVTVLTKINTECSKDGGVNNLHSCDIEYVHQLQQAIRICGIEKNIEL